MKVCIVTATRAEYGLLRPLIEKVQLDNELELQLVVTGTHLSARYGNTVSEIEEDGFPIAARIDILSDNDDAMGMVRTVAAAAEGFGQFFEKNHQDIAVVLGDRYELLGICEAALLFKIPVVHISGGEITEGAIDDTVRHCITKMSTLHFPGCEAYRRRIIQLGEQPNLVFNYGDIGVENIMMMDYMDKEELERSIGCMLAERYVCVTFHPATLDELSPEHQIEEVLNALDNFPELQMFFTGANADAGGKIINDRIQEFVKRHSNCYYYDSLGIRRFLSLLRGSEMIIGNSSSGIVEAPCFGIPTVNIGNRQKGRLRSDSIIDCAVECDDINRAIRLASTYEFKKKARMSVNPYGKGHTSEMIVKEIKKYLKDTGNRLLAKRFYDIYQE